MVADKLAAALAHQQKGRTAQAKRIYGEILADQPGQPRALNLLGMILLQEGKVAEATQSIAKAISRRPNVAQFHVNYGRALWVQKRFAAAIGAFQKAIALNPKHPGAYFFLANALDKQGQKEQSEAAYRRAIELKPDLPLAHLNRGHVLAKLGRTDEATASFEKALQYRPGLFQAFNALGYVRHFQGMLDEAIESLRKAIELAPQFPLAHYNLGMALLLAGHFGEGWKEYDWRWQGRELRRLKARYPGPRWDGKAAPDQTIILHTEQGFGDTLQFVRYAPLVAKLGGRVILECQKPLVRLLRNSDGLGVDRVMARGVQRPKFDTHFPLMSLPLIFKTTPKTVPSDMPYLKADDRSWTLWRKRFLDDKNFKVGLVWAGNPTHSKDQHRSIGLEALKPLLETAGASFYSLQVGPRARDCLTVPTDKLTNLAPDLFDFAETAAAVSHLDLVITVDTSVAHLTGALGRPVWVLLPFVPDWRWLTEREDSLWYPSMRLFRQSQPESWGPVIEQVRTELARLAGKGGKGGKSRVRKATARKPSKAKAAGAKRKAVKKPKK